MAFAMSLDVDGWLFENVWAGIIIKERNVAESEGNGNEDEDGGKE